MTPVEIAVRIVAGVLLIGINAYFVAIEFALTRLRQYPESEFTEGNLKKAWEMTDELEKYLTTCQIWISGTSIALGIIAEPGLAALIEPLFKNTFVASVGAGSFIAFFIINMVHLTHGEQTPTYLGVERSKQVAKYGCRPLYFFSLVISPLIKVGDVAAKSTLGLFGVQMTASWTDEGENEIQGRAQLTSELHRMFDEAKISSERRDEVLNAFKVGEMKVNDIMVDRDDIISLSTNEDIQQELDRMKQSSHSRFPVIDGESAEYKGVIYSQSIIRNFDELRYGDKSISDIATNPMTISPQTTVSDAYDQFQTQRQEIALITHNGNIEGLISLTDIIETIMGEHKDPIDSQDE